MNNKTFIIVMTILVCVSIVAFISYLPTRVDIASKIKVANLPMEIGEWKAEDLPIDTRTYEILETKNFFIREYKNPQGESVYLYIVYSEDNRRVSHPPEVCLMGSGSTVVNKTSIPITDTIKANKLIVEKGDIQEIVVYWFKAGDLQTDTYLKQQFKIVTDRMLAKRTSGALIRLSTNIEEGKEEAAVSLIREFCKKMVPLLDKYIP